MAPVTKLAYAFQQYSINSIHKFLLAHLYIVQWSCNVMPLSFFCV